MLRIKKRYKAVTLVELLIVIAIISILAGVSVVSLQSARNFSRLKAAQREVASQIKLAQSYALQGRAQSGVTPCGYGFRFDSADSNNQKYEIFYNLPTVAQPSCSVRDKKHDVDSAVMESQQLGNGVKLDLTSPGITLIDNSIIYFTVPHGSIYDKDGNPYTEKKFKFSLGSYDKTITISPGGKITED